MVNEKHIRTKTQWLICAMLHRVRPVCLDIWHVERCVCFWLSCLSGPTSSSTAITFFSVPACFSLPVSCFWSCFMFSKFLLLTCPVFFSFAFCLSFIKNLISILRKPLFIVVYVFNQSLVSIAKWHITVSVYHFYIKNYFWLSYCYSKARDRL